MSYMGVRLQRSAHIIAVNLHGPLMGFPVLPTKVRQSIIDFLDRKRTVNMIVDAHNLAMAIADEYCDGDKILWIEVIVQSPDDIMYTAVEERLANVQSLLS